MRYLLFTGLVYYPRGGAQDFHAAFATYNEAVAAGRHFAEHGADAEWNKWNEFESRDAWWHVLDLESRTIVATSERARRGGHD